MKMRPDSNPEVSTKGGNPFCPNTPIAVAGGCPPQKHRPPFLHSPLGASMALEVRRSRSQPRNFHDVPTIPGGICGISRECTRHPNHPDRSDSVRCNFINFIGQFRVTSIALVTTKHNQKLTRHACDSHSRRAAVTNSHGERAIPQRP